MADALNLRIHIIESNDNFSDISLVEAQSTTNDQRSIYIGHIGEIHYISTCSEFSERNSNQIDTGDLCIDSCESTENIQKRKCNSNITEYQKKRLSENSIDSENACNTIGECQTSKTKKRKEQKAMRQYRAAKSSIEEKERQRIYKKNYRASRTSIENKEKNNEYKKHYRASKRSTEQKAKNNEYMKNYRASKRSDKEKAKNNAYMKKYREMCSTHENIESLICKFHEIVSQGPLYICTCCDQLWFI